MCKFPTWGVSAWVTIYYSYIMPIVEQLYIYSHFQSFVYKAAF